MSSLLVDSLGMAAGCIWMSAAFYFQMVRSEQVEPAYIAGMFLIGLSLMLSASAIAVMDAQLAATLAVLGQVLFLILGIASWYVLEMRANLRAQQDPDSYDDPSQA